MKCQACGHENADNALFCAACRRPLVAASPLPSRLEPLAPAPAPAPMDTPYEHPALAGNRYAASASDGAGRTRGDAAILTMEEAQAAFIGDTNAAYYQEKFYRLARGEGGGFHWPGLLVTWYWMLYRKMWVPALIYFFAPYAIMIVVGILGALSPALGGLTYLAWLVAWLIGPGLLANGWYYKHAQARIRDVRARGGSKEQMLARIEAAGGTSNIAVIILAFLAIFCGIGILAAVALPAYQTYTVKAKVSEAVVEGAEVAQAVGRQYEQTGQFPSDVEGLVAKVSRPSKYVSRIEVDGATGVLTVRVEAAPRITGSVLFTPALDDGHHVTWTCSSDDMTKYVPADCRH